MGGAGNPGGVGGVGGAGSPGGVGGVGGAGRPGGVGGAGGASQLPAGGNNWQHNPAHRGGAPYGDRATADRFGGAARGDSLANRQAGARNQIGSQGGNLASNRGGAGASNRMNSGGGFGGGGGGLGGGSDRVGSRDVSRPSGGDRSAFGSGSRGGYNGSSARSASSRGSSSFGGGGRGGGGGGRSGGGRRR